MEKTTRNGRTTTTRRERARRDEQRARDELGGLEPAQAQAWFKATLPVAALTPSQVLVGRALADYQGPGLAWGRRVDQRALADQLGVHVKTVGRAFRVLRELGRIRYRRRWIRTGAGPRSPIADLRFYWPKPARPLQSDILTDVKNPSPGVLSHSPGGRGTNRGVPGTPEPPPVERVYPDWHPMHPANRGGYSPAHY